MLECEKISPEASRFEYGSQLIIQLSAKRVSSFYMGRNISTGDLNYSTYKIIVSFSFAYGSTNSEDLMATSKCSFSHQVM
jgi:hypothetical protein